jgi:hypothetical protein
MSIGILKERYDAHHFDGSIEKVTVEVAPAQPPQSPNK